MYMPASEALPMDVNLHLTTPSEFPAFPYDPPYHIQTQLMHHLYESIEKGKVSIIESPTGTGKTLSLLCASLTWLSDDRERARKGKLKEVACRNDLDAKDWVVQQTLTRLRRELEGDDRDFQDRLATARKREEAWKRAKLGRAIKRPRIMIEESLNDDDEAQFLPETDPGGTDGSGDMHISPALRALMAKVDKGSKPAKHLHENEVACTKIFYASRTHSQLSQVLPELSKLKLNDKPTSLTNYHPPEFQAASSKRALEDVVTSVEIPTRTVSLGSRKHLCIDDQLRLKARDLDEACRERLGEKEDKRCPYLPSSDDEGRLHDFRDQILAFPKDIEDLAAAGRHFNTCPYFASRGAIPQAELVALPYNLLLKKSARETLGIKLEGNIVIIDEAHNLIPTLLSLSTVHLTFATLLLSFQQICTYVSHFKTRLSPVNMLHLKRLVVFLDSLKAYAAKWKEEKRNTKPNQPEVMTVGELISRLGKKIAGINLMELEAYLKKSKIARKIACYFDKHVGNDSSVRDQIRKGMIPPLHFVEDFIISLMNSNHDGRVSFKLSSSPGQESIIEMTYHLLNPSPSFREIVEEARSVVLAGGTMSPLSDVISQLFSYLPEEKITTFSCGHIIPEDNLRALVVGRSPSGETLEFKSEKQTDPAIVSKIGQVLRNFVKVIPAGMIVFFPSYKFLHFSREVWVKDGTLDEFAAKKQLFFEPDDASVVEKVLAQYAIAATKPDENKNGALLFAVIGAKLSEGLNFSDDLARAVVVIGLPFANLGSPELQERLKYVKRLDERQGGKKAQGQKDAAAELYENMCMNAVNQSIGRAIRHKGDWASLILVDARYSTPSIKKKLPGWIGERLIVTDNFGQAVKELGNFFRSRRTTGSGVALSVLVPLELKSTSLDMGEVQERRQQSILVQTRDLL